MAGYGDRPVVGPGASARSEIQLLAAIARGKPIVAIENHCTPDRTTAVRSVCTSFQLLL